MRGSSRVRAVVFSGLCLGTGAAVFAGCTREKGSSFDLRLKPDSTCQSVPVECADTLRLTLSADALPSDKQWDFAFQVPSSPTNLGALSDLPTSGQGRFRAAGVTSNGTGAIVFSGTSALLTFTTKNQGVQVPVSCVLPPVCATPTPIPSPTPTPFTSGSDALIVVGQPNFTECDPNGNGLANSLDLREPEGIFADYASDFLWVTEFQGNRVTSFPNLAAIANTPTANMVICQGNIDNIGNTGSSANDCDRPNGVVRIGTQLLFGDQNNDRTPVFALPAMLNDDSTASLGQADNNSTQGANRGGAPAADTQAQTYGVTVAGTMVFVSDRGNHRILRYDGTALANDQDANLVLGQATFATGAANAGGAPSASGLNQPAHVATDGVRLYVADTLNNRVLVWLDVNALTDGKPADLVVGQPDFTTVTAGAVSATSLALPRGVAATPQRLVVADTGNHRLLIWQPPPAVNGAPATQVLGQQTFATNAPNTATADGCGNIDTCDPINFRPDQKTLSRPGGVSIVGDNLWVADTCNHRALLYRPPAAFQLTPGPGSR